MLSVKDIRVVEKGDRRVPRLLPSQAGDKPPRYIFPYRLETSPRRGR